jgi:hypothetical protein
VEDLDGDSVRNAVQKSVKSSQKPYPRKTIDTHLYWSENAIARKGIQEFKNGRAGRGFTQEVTT